MSNTYRSTSHGWEPGNPDFDSWNSDNRIKSRKHQTKDRSGFGKKNHRKSFSRHEPKGALAKKHLEQLIEKEQYE